MMFDIYGQCNVSQKTPGLSHTGAIDTQGALRSLCGRRYDGCPSRMGKLCGSRLLLIDRNMYTVIDQYAYQDEAE
jgi:hypothetical protein